MMGFAVNSCINKYIFVPSCRYIMSQKFSLYVGARHTSSYHRLLARNQLNCCIRKPSANFCQARTVCNSALTSGTLFSGKAVSRHHWLPSCQAFLVNQQKSLLSLSAAVSATSASNVELDLTLDSSSTLTAPLDTADVVLDAASAAVEPTLQSLGLAASTPGGFIQAGLESLHIGLGVPWWTAIVIGTICVRIAMFPLVILGQRNAAEMHNHMPTIQRLQQRMSAARRAGDLKGSLAASNELASYMQRNNVNPLKNLVVPFAQLPIFVSVYSGLREMAQLPVVSMQSGGLLWFMDLTIRDPYYALPLMTVTTLLVTIEVGTDSVAAAQMDKTMRYFLRAMPIFMLPFIAKFPAAMLCYWFTSNTFSLMQVLILRIPAVRQFCKIAPRIDHTINTHVQDTGIPASFMEGFRETMDNMRLAREIEERQRYDALQMKKSTKQTQSDSTAEKVSEKAKKSQQL